MMKYLVSCVVAVVGFVILQTFVAIHMRYEYCTGICLYFQIEYVCDA